MAKALELIGLRKQYDPDSPPAVEDMSLSLSKGEILALVGPSGCGKTTVLRLIAGFERPDSGVIIIGGQIVASPPASPLGGRERGGWVPPERRGVGMVFQEHALFPHLTVAENVAFGLAGQSAAAVAAETRSMLRLVGLEDFAGRYPHELSGGERQRAALARAFAPRPVVVLLDEPFSSLDADRRVQMREDVRAILKGLGATAIFVTHDQEEALFMGDRVAVQNAGRLEQVGIPDEIFGAPASRFVAEFMGHTDFIPGEVVSEGLQTEIGLLAQPTPFSPGTHVDVAVRADDVTLTPDPASKARVLARHFKGTVNVYRVRLPSGRIVHSLQAHTLALAPGTLVRVRAEPGHALACFATNGDEAH